ncbi:MAG TPA: hypothetical protein QKA14_02625 [Candidatus Megaira endosymbiont of Hartmannula sinica]|nr:hypothetical protein [Candidatus Megaera endosymbiont of Hartmannula sinica]
MANDINFNKIVTIDSPGSKQVLETAIKQNYFDSDKDLLTEIEGKIYGVNNTPNFINKTNTHIGENQYMLTSFNNDQDLSGYSYNDNSSYYSLLGKYLLSTTSYYINILNINKTIHDHGFTGFEDNLSEDCVYIVPFKNWSSNSKTDLAWETVTKNQEFQDFLEKDLTLSHTDFKFNGTAVSLNQIKRFIKEQDTMQIVNENNTPSNIFADNAEFDVDNNLENIKDNSVNPVSELDDFILIGELEDSNDSQDYDLVDFDFNI